MNKHNNFETLIDVSIKHLFYEVETIKNNWSVQEKEITNRKL
jgi:predicted nuclease of restriction endonuclease-like (RecB) superfamily